jgi:hypothetical protein
VLTSNPEVAMPIIRMVIETFEIPNKQEIIAELNQALQQAAQNQAAAQQAQAKEIVTMAYKDAPEDIKRQIEAQDGFTPSQTTSPVQQEADAKTMKAHTDAISALAPAEPPKTEQGRRADAEAKAALKAK